MKYLPSKKNLLSSKYSYISYILLVATIIRLFALYNAMILQRDSILYIQLAQKWYDAKDYYIMLSNIDSWLNKVPPLFLYLIKCMIGLGIKAELSARLLTFGCGIFVPIIGYLIAYNISSKRWIANAMGFFFAVNPSLVEYSIQPTRDMIYLFLIGLTLLFICRGTHYQAIKEWCFCGVFCALSLNVRYESIEVFFFIIIFIIISILIKQYSLCKGITHLLLFFISFSASFILINLLMGTSRSIYEAYSSYFEETILKISAIWI